MHSLGQKNEIPNSAFPMNVATFFSRVCNRLPDLSRHGWIHYGQKKVISIFPNPISQFFLTFNCLNIQDHKSFLARKFCNFETFLPRFFLINICINLWGDTQFCQLSNRVKFLERRKAFFPCLGLSLWMLLYLLKSIFRKTEILERRLNWCFLLLFTILLKKLSYDAKFLTDLCNSDVYL